MHCLDNRCLETEHHICRQRAERQCIRACARSFSHRVRFRCRRGRKQIVVVSRSANQRIITAAAGQLVVAAPAIDHVSIFTSVNSVVTVIPADGD